MKIWISLQHKVVIFLKWKPSVKSSKFNVDIIPDAWGIVLFKINYSYDRSQDQWEAGKLKLVSHLFQKAMLLTTEQPLKDFQFKDFFFLLFHVSLCLSR